ncbi:hypothetical protein DENSPDRAFT_839235, partial [Dentipellis sp. KUC8613]
SSRARHVCYRKSSSSQPKETPTILTDRIASHQVRMRSTDPSQHARWTHQIESKKKSRNSRTCSNI